MVKNELGSNCAEFNFSIGGRKQLLPSEASSGHKLRNCALWGFFHPKIEEFSQKFQEIPSERQIPSWGEKFRALASLPTIWLFLWVKYASTTHLLEDNQGFALYLYKWWVFYYLESIWGLRRTLNILACHQVCAPLSTKSRRIAELQGWSLEAAGGLGETESRRIAFLQGWTVEEARRAGQRAIARGAHICLSLCSL